MSLIIKRAERRNKEGRRVFTGSCGNHYLPRTGLGSGETKGAQLPRSGREESEGHQDGNLQRGRTQQRTGTSHQARTCLGWGWRGGACEAQGKAL